MNITLPAHVTEKTRDFIGRVWVFNKISSWLNDADGTRFFIISGEPGIGKSAILARLIQNRHIDAYHFCVAHQIDTIDPYSFIRSICSQLLEIEGFSQSLLSQGNVEIHAEQTINNNSGNAVNVNIEKLVLNSTPSLFSLASLLVTSLKDLIHKGYEGQIIILVDALDESIRPTGMETIVDLLTLLEGLPNQVRFVLSTRPANAVLRHFKSQSFTILPLEAENLENRQDVREFLNSRLKDDQILIDCLSKHPLPLDKLIERMLMASEGNLLYLVWLVRAIIEGYQLPEDERASLPKGLNGIYCEFFRTRSIGRSTELWNSQYLSIMGILAVSKDILSFNHLVQFTGFSKQDLWLRLVEIQQFLDPVSLEKGQYQLYHLSIADFLFDENGAYEFWIDKDLMHQKIVNYYRGDKPSWIQIDWRIVDDYGIRHLANHLSSQFPKTNLHELVYCLPYMEQKYKRLGSYGAYSEDVALAIQTAKLGTPPDLVNVIRGCLTYGALSSNALQIQPEILGGLALLGRHIQANDFVWLIPDFEVQTDANLAIGGALIEIGEIDLALENLDRAWQLLTHDEVSANTERMVRLVKYYILANNLEKAEMVAKQISSLWYRFRALIDLGYVFLEKGNFDRVLNVANIAKVTVLSLREEHLLYEGALVDTACLMAKAGSFDEARKTSDLIKDDLDRSSSSRKISIEFAERGHLEEALKIIKDINDRFLGPGMISDIADVFIKNGRMREARIAIGQIGSKWERYEALGNLALAIAAQGNYDRAITILDSIKDSRVKVKTYAMLARILSEHEQKNLALRYVALTLKLVSKLPPAEETVFSYVATAYAQFANENTTQAKYLLHQALEVATRVSFEWEKEKILTEASRLLIELADGEGLDKLLEYIQGIENVESRARLCVELFENLIQTRDDGWKKRFVIATKDSIHQIKDDSYYKIPLVATLSMLLHKIEAKDEAIILASQSFELAKRNFENKKEIQCFDPVIEASNILGNEKLLYDMWGFVCKSATIDNDSAGILTSIVSALVRLGKFSFDKLVMLSVEKLEHVTWHRIYALTSFAKSFVEYGYTELALQIVTTGVADISKLPDGWGKASLFAGLGLVYSSLGCHPEAIELEKRALEMISSEKEGLSLVVIFHNIIAVALKAKDKLLLSQALDIASNANESVHKDSIFKSLAGAFETLGDHFTALEVSAKACTSNTHKNIETSVDVISQGIRNGQLSETIAAINNMSDINQRALTYGRVVLTLAQNKSADYLEILSFHALELIKNDVDPIIAVTMLINFSKAYEIATLQQKAFDLAENAATKANEIDNLVEKCSTLLEITELWVELKFTAKAIRAADEARKCADKITTINDRFKSLLNVSSVMFRIGQYTQAVELAYALMDTEYIYIDNMDWMETQHLVIKIIEDLWECGEQDRGLQILCNLLDRSRKRGLTELYRLFPHLTSFVASIDECQTLKEVYSIFVDSKGILPLTENFNS